MFNQLRNRFMLLNLATIALIMLIAFGSIYIITYQDVKNDIALELRRVADFHQRPQGGEGPRPEGGAAGQTVGEAESGSAGPEDRTPGDRPGGVRQGIVPGNTPGGLSDRGLMEAPVDRAVTFMLRSDAEWNLLENESKFEMDDRFFEEALLHVARSKRQTGQFTLDGSHWSYMVSFEGTDKTVVFLDVSARQAILGNLVYTFGIVGLAMLIVLFFASRYFANRSIRPVKEAFDKQKQFIADASHELKTPLTIIHTNADVLLGGGAETAAERAKWLGYIKSETERMTRLTNDLLYLTEMDDYRAHMIATRFSASEAAEHIVLTMEAVLFEKGLSFEADVEADVAVNGNAEQIKQVIMILLDNAIKYTPPKGRVSLTLKKQSQEAALSVSNTGDGISAEHLPHIFDRFYRTDSSRARKQGGHGLGLAIAKSIVEGHKGRITVRSELRGITTFTVFLPLAQ